MALPFPHVLRLRVRYSETDQLGTFYNSRALEWFECGRTELLRAIGAAYADLEKRGVCLPLVEAHVNYLGRARYDDLLEMKTVMSMAGKASFRFDMSVDQAHGGAPVVTGYTVHAITNADGKPMRCPAWLAQTLEAARPPAPGGAGVVA
jgi:acyl-CoA thioester hydrolase